MYTASALLAIASTFNHDYDTGDYAPVYARWDARSQAIIGEADYIQRHRQCPGAHNSSRTEDDSPGGPHGTWLVHYEIGGQQLTVLSWQRVGATGNPGRTIAGDTVDCEHYEATFKAPAYNGPGEPLTVTT